MVFYFVLSFLLSSESLFAQGGATPSVNYPSREERVKLLNVIKSVKPQVLIFRNLQRATPEDRIFIDYFRDNIWGPLSKYGVNPELGNDSFGSYSTLQSLYYVGIDRALYKNETEKEHWKNRMLALEAEAVQYMTSMEWKNKLKTIYQLSLKVKGPIAQWIQQIYEQNLLLGFESKDFDKVQRLRQLEAQVKTISNNTPIAPFLGENQRQVELVLKNFYSKKVSFNEASFQLEKLKEHSMAAHGHFIATQSNRDLNEIAVLRTQLARSKGFKNWAEYQLASNKQHYMPGYQKPSERIEFLKSVLKLTYSTHEKFLHARLQELDSSLRVENLSESQISLLNLPGAVFLKDYFPIENVNEFWQRTMAESGFSESSIKSIQFDNFPRAGKQTHAYMMSARGWKPRHFILDSTSDAGLFLRTPDSRWRNNVNEWDPSLIYIVQNMRTNGIASFRTLFHEGGHGLDFSFREDHLSQGQDSSYTETHSKTMEMFFKDREFIERTAQKLNGEKPSSELIEAYFKNSRWNDFISFRYQISNALYDLELWNREYKSGDDFVQSALDLDEKYQRKYFFGKTETLQGALNSSYGKFATGHFYGGQVRYIGYVFAQMAATMTYERLLDKFEELNGRRTLSEQSTLADELIKGYYTKGFLQPFPQATEVFTGKKFDALAISQSILAQVEHVALRSESSLESRSKKLNAPVCKKIF